MTILAVTGVELAGQDVVYVTGVLVLVLVVLTGSWAGSLVTVAHEGGHMALAVLTGRNHRGFSLAGGGGGQTDGIDGRWGVGAILTFFAGYVTPPLLGLGGAALVVGDQLLVVLWAALVLLVAAVVQSRNGLAIAVTVLAVLGVGWTIFVGGPVLQAAVAVGMVWLLLFGGLRAAVVLSRADGTDPYWLARHTLIPRIVWHGVFVGIALLCLWTGGSWLLGV